MIKCSGLLLNYNGQPAYCRTGRYERRPGSGHFWHFDRQVQMETSHTDVCKKKFRLCGGLQTRFKAVLPVMLRSDHCAKNEGDRCTINQNNGLSRIAYSPLHLHLKKFTSAQHIHPGLVGDALPRPWKLVGLRGVVWAIPKHNVWTITSWDCGGCTARDLIRWTACHVSARYWGILPAWVIEQVNRQRKWESKCHITSCCHIQRWINQVVWLQLTTTTTTAPSFYLITVRQLNWNSSQVILQTMRGKKEESVYSCVPIQGPPSKDMFSQNIREYHEGQHRTRCSPTTASQNNAL